MLAAKLRDPPQDNFRLVVVLPAKANNGQDDTQGQLGRAGGRRRRGGSAARRHAALAHRRPRGPAVRARQGRDRRRPVADGRLGQSQRSLAVQRHRDERLHRSSRAGPPTRGCACGPSTSTPTPRRSPADPSRRSSTSCGGRSPPSSCAGARPASRPPITCSRCPASHVARGGCSGRCKVSSTTAESASAADEPVSDSRRNGQRFRQIGSTPTHRARRHRSSGNSSANVADPADEPLGFRESRCRDGLAKHRCLLLLRATCAPKRWSVVSSVWLSA